MKILLLSDIPPCTNYTSGLFLDQLCRFLPEGSLAIFAVVPAEFEIVSAPGTDHIPMMTADRPAEYMPDLRPRPLGNAVSRAINIYTRQVIRHDLVRKAVAYGKEQGVDAVWGTLEGQTLIRMVSSVANGLGVPLLTQVFDPPYWWLRSHLVDPASSRAILRCFEDALRSSRGCAAGSWAMAKAYQADYGTRTVPVIPSIAADLVLPPASSCAPDTITIGIAGQLYAGRELDALIRALQKAHWKVGGRDVRIKLLSRAFQYYTSGELHLEWLGWHSQAESIRMLSEMDVLYCPYWFDPAFEREARLSFPSKLTTYLAAGRPVLFHGPEYASPWLFLKEHGAGAGCHSLEPDEILSVLSLLSDGGDYYRSLAAQGHRAVLDNLTMDSLKKSFADFLSVPESFLLSDTQLTAGT